MLRHLQALYDVGTLIGLTDQQLLERFHAANEEGDHAAAEATFSALVERHAPMVWRVCRSLVRDPHDAEDAFQATFLVLVRKAPSLRIRETLGPWLYVVAYRIGLSTRSSAARRRAVERAAAISLREAVEPASPGDVPGCDDDLRASIHAEIMKLSGPSRAVVVLCDLGGMSYLEAARRLNVPLGTVQSRLARARQRLRRALTRQGIGMPASSGARDPSPDTMLGVIAAAGLPYSLARRTSRLCLLLATDPTRLESIVAVSITALVKGGLRSMFFSNLNRAFLGLMGGVLFSDIVFHQHANSSQPRQDAQRPQSQPAPGRIEEKGPVDRRIEIPAPREIKVAAGRGKALVYALDDVGQRVPDRNKELGNRALDLSKEEEREIRWSVVTGIVEHRRLQDGFRREGRSAPLTAVHYRRVDLERQRLEKDGTWSAWEPVDFEANVRILDNVPEVEEELTPEEVRIGALVDPLPFLKSGAWRGVDVERFVPPERRKRQDSGIKPANPNPPPPGSGVTNRGELMGLMRGLGIKSPGQSPPGAEPVLLMLRTFDFSVESGRTYRYRARVVLFNRSRRSDSFGSWSESTDIVTVP